MSEQIPPPVQDSPGLRRGVGLWVGAAAILVSGAFLASPGGKLELLAIAAFVGLAGFVLGRWLSSWFGHPGMAGGVVAALAFWFCTIVSAALGGAFTMLLSWLSQSDAAMKDLGLTLTGFLGGVIIGVVTPFLPIMEAFHLASLLWWLCLIAVHLATRRLRRREETRKTS